jgi:pimeloyl-ACP methyl ester carboxylesterase
MTSPLRAGPIVVALVNVLFATPVSAATVDGIPLHSSASGKGPRTLILVHGWTCDDRTWKSQVPELSRSYRVITLDLPGHGQSGSPKDGKLSMDLFARAIGVRAAPSLAQLRSVSERHDERRLSPGR